MTEELGLGDMVGCQGGVLDVRVQERAEPYCPCYVLP